MLCQLCRQQDATVLIEGTQVSRESSGEAESTEEVRFDLCRSCAEGYEQRLTSQSLFPERAEPTLTEQLRVLSVGAEWTVLRVIRTENEEVPEDWRVLTARLGESSYEAGQEITLVCTPSEVEWLKGNGGLPGPQASG